jgi:hypothetical protein
MSQSRLHDLVFLLGLVLPACDAGDDDPDADDREALDEAVDACRPFGRAVAACYGEEEGVGYVSAVGYCVASIGYASDEPACAAAYRDLFACLAETDCDELVGVDEGAGDDGEEPPPPPCDAEENAVGEACGDVSVDASED